MIRTFTVGPFFTNCYPAICGRTKEAIIVDPGFNSRHEAAEVSKTIDKNGLKPKFVVNMHGHPDHVCWDGIVKDRYAVPILIHQQDSYMLGEPGKQIAESFGFRDFSPQADKLLHDRNLVGFDEVTLEVMHTPGHTRGCISLLGKNGVFTGDTLFAGSIGRTDFPESSEYDVKRSLRKLAALSDDLIACPGHGSTTTNGEEKLNNPFLLRLGS